MLMLEYNISNLIISHHELITDEYIQQIAPKMLTVTAPLVTIQEQIVTIVNKLANPATLADSKTDNSNEKSLLYPPRDKRALEWMIEHAVKYKRIPLIQRT